MADPRPGSSDRLDSWKAIADHLGREVRTVRRWEQKLGLPVRRVPGGRGHSVFAYVSEIDAWLKATPPAQQAPDPGVKEAAEPSSSPRRFGLRFWAITGAAILLTATAAVAWRQHSRAALGGALTFRLYGGTLVAAGPSGDERWRYAFAGDGIANEFVFHGSEPATVLQKDAGVILAVPMLARKKDEGIFPGQVLWFAKDGALRRVFSFQDRVRFDAGEYSGWALSDFRVIEQDGRRQIAVAAHDYRWWPSVVTVLDDDWRPRGTFVNAGWVEQVQWQSADRLLLSGFSNARDGGMVALLDTNALNGTSPIWHDEAFRCRSCGDAAPLRYVVFPRSELNRLTVSRFNRARVDIVDDRMVARTVEIPIQEGLPAIDALYELTPSLDVVRASYSDQYWQMHRELEAEGKVHHTREQCPDRDGPRSVEIWDRAAGWRTVAINRQ